MSILEVEKVSKYKNIFLNHFPSEFKTDVCSGLINKKISTFDLSKIQYKPYYFYDTVWIIHVISTIINIIHQQNN